MELSKDQIVNKCKAAELNVKIEDGIVKLIFDAVLRSVQEQNIMRTHHYFSRNQKSDSLRNSLKE